jgi:hypothetical protein
MLDLLPTGEGKPSLPTGGGMLDLLPTGEGKPSLPTGGG